MKHRILFFHDTFPAGGAERVTQDIADYISNKGYEVYLIASHLNVNDCQHLHLIEVPDNLSLREEATQKFIIEVIREKQISQFVLPAFMNPDICQAVREHTSCKIVFALHGLPLYEKIVYLYEKKRWSSKSFIKTILWRGIIYPKVMWLHLYDKRFLADYKRMYHLVDAFTVLCSGYKQQLARLLSLGADNHIHVISNAEKPVPAEWCNDKKKQVIYSGRLDYFKRVDILLKIWQKIFRKAPDWELVIIGDGPEKKNLENLAEQWKLERVSFIGYVSDVGRFYRQASIICLTSAFEGFPLCLTEAQSYGVIPMAFNASKGVEEIIGGSGDNGILLPMGSTHRFAKELLSLMHDEERRCRMKQQVREKAKDYDADLIGGKWLSLFNSLLGQGDVTVYDN
ncbi:glycosyltransferase [Phocaeicola faecicola]|jgi:glycosyltransferase involved in cell wall biosynthesis|uniref:glycosyltransferase n=1 Tax=Phocaeicola faecicola TaxID=2739389 RepID=UPI0015E7C1C5|nr:glycosyltransferase [Phocaeicola faecicola]MCI5742855.1 glycosyltransferase [Bacteroides sp.]MDD6909308.1 glycosyltransferase [Bacteroidaceae bacterium]MDY4873003.1 glycosyltransferase [Phocaeicola faecicola]